MGGASIDPSGRLICVDSVERYVPSTDTWISVATMMTPRAEFGCTQVANSIYVVGGYNWTQEKRISSVELFDTDTHTWTLGGDGCDLIEPLTGIACCSLNLFDNTTSTSKHNL